VLAMGARCERVVRLAFEAFCRGAPEFTGPVEALDAQIDRDDIEIHALILRILALRQPVADDLRFLAAAYARPTRRWLISLIRGDLSPVRGPS
jgi:phosphate transport system protein